MGDLLSRLDYIKRAVNALDNLLKEEDVEEVLNDFILQNSVLHLLQTSAQALLDIGSRVLSEMGEKPPAIYGEVAIRLGDVGILSREESDLMVKIIGFRNIIVYGYLGINMELLSEILRERRYRDVLRIATSIVEKSKDLGIDP